MSKLKDIFKNLLIFLLLFIIVIVLIVPRGLSSKEHFVNTVINGYTSESLYRDTLTNSPSSSAINTYDKLASSLSFNTNDDKMYELTMKRCYQYPKIKFDDIVKGWLINQHRDIFTQSFSLSTIDFNEVKGKIISSIQNAHDSQLNGGIPSPIRGPVYVEIIQVPYYRNSQNNPIDIKSFSVSAYNFQAEHNELKSNVNSYTQPINYYCIIYYPRYTPNGILQPKNKDTFTSQKLPQRDKKYASGEQQCYMHAQGANDGQNVYAGCSSSSGLPLKNKLSNYVANCFGPKPGNNLLQSDPRDTLTTLSTYSILYTVNINALSLKTYFFNNNNTYPTPWQYSTDIQSPQGFIPVRFGSQNELECIQEPGTNISKCYSTTGQKPKDFVATNSALNLNNNSGSYQTLPVMACNNPRDTLANNICNLYNS